MTMADPFPLYFPQVLSVEREPILSLFFTGKSLIFRESPGKFVLRQGFFEVGS
jgi:hypothetical protein